MPEIPEMELYRMFLEQSVVGRVISDVKINRERSINVSGEQFSAQVIGQRVVLAGRRAKFIFLKLSNVLFLCAHMMLDGRIYFQPTEDQTPQLPGKSYIELRFEQGGSLHFCELRLGYLKLLNQEGIAELFKDLGIEPLSDDFTLPKLRQILARKKGMLKPVLMDQSLITGIGNAYSNEILFRAGILPERKVPLLKESEVSKLYEAIPSVLKEAITLGGYIEEPFAPWDKLSGGAMAGFMVYERTGKPCLRCGRLINEKAVGGRRAFFCQSCQQ